jgi:hypothetical protein
MSLIPFWKSNRPDVEAMQLNQIVAIAGDGVLKDGSDAAAELREYFSAVPTELLGNYLYTCLDKAFSDSGLVLQDVVNELGARLDCTVEPGRYRGRAGDIGFDGIWSYPNGYSIVVEVKTTDAYSIDLDTVADYRKRLIDQGRISGESSILMVVGRTDTGGLEAQVRGSRHAWDMRIISADALYRLVQTKEDADSSITIEKIRSLLVPQELTRLDFIVDLLATTADDIKSDFEEEEKVERTGGKKFTPSAFNAEVADRVAQHLQLDLKKKSRSLFTSLDNGTGIICPVSKAYPSTGKTFYWYAFHPHQKDILEKYGTAYVAFGCGGPETILLIPFEWIVQRLPDMNMTENDIRSYWHIQFYKTAEGKMFTNFRSGTKVHDVSSYLI